MGIGRFFKKIDSNAKSFFKKADNTVSGVLQKAGNIAQQVGQGAGKIAQVAGDLAVPASMLLGPEAGLGLGAVAGAAKGIQNLSGKADQAVKTGQQIHGDVKSAILKPVPMAQQTTEPAGPIFA